MELILKASKPFILLKKSISCIVYIQEVQERTYTPKFHVLFPLIQNFSNYSCKKISTTSKKHNLSEILNS